MPEERLHVWLWSSRVFKLHTYIVMPYALVFTIDWSEAGHGDGYVSIVSLCKTLILTSLMRFSSTGGWTNYSLSSNGISSHLTFYNHWFSPGNRDFLFHFWWFFVIGFLYIHFKVAIVLILLSIKIYFNIHKSGFSFIHFFNFYRLRGIFTLIIVLLL